MVFLGSTVAFAQIDTNLLRVEHHWYGQRFFQGEKRVSLSDLIDLSEGDQISNDLFRKANNRHDFARFSQATGTFLILYPFINEALDRDPNFNLVYIGAGLWALSVPLEISARHIATQGIMRYNAHQKTRKLGLVINPLQMKVALKF